MLKLAGKTTVNGSSIGKTSSMRFLHFFNHLSSSPPSWRLRSSLSNLMAGVASLFRISAYVHISDFRLAHHTPIKELQAKMEYLNIRLIWTQTHLAMIEGKAMSLTSTLLYKRSRLLMASRSSCR